MGLNFRKFQAERPERGEVFTVFVNSHLSDDCLKLGKIVELHFYRKVSKKKMPEMVLKIDLTDKVDESYLDRAVEIRLTS